MSYKNIPKLGIWWKVTDLLQLLTFSFSCTSSASYALNIFFSLSIHPWVSLCWKSHVFFVARCPPPPPYERVLQLNVILFHAEEEKKTERHKKGESDRKRCWGNGYPLVCVQDSPHVAVLSLQQHPSVAFCVAQWLLNTRPSRRITPASESLQTNTPTRILDSRKTSCLALLLTSPPLTPFPQFHFDGWWRVQSCGPPVLSWCEPKPIWDSISCLPALSTLKTTTILSWGRKFRTHYSLFRSRPRSKSSPPASICCVVYRVKSAAFAFSLCPIYPCSYVSRLFLKPIRESTRDRRLEKRWAAGICYSL